MIHCPRCQKELEKLDTEIGEAWMCPECDGMLLKELDPFLKMSEEQLRQSPLQEGLFADHPEVELDNLVCCPLCSQTMRRLNYCGDSGIVIDSCPDGHGVWLDDGELARIFDYMQGVAPGASKEEKASALAQLLNPPHASVIPDEGDPTLAFLKPPQRP